VPAAIRLIVTGPAMRLDQALAGNRDGVTLGRRRVQALIAAGAVRVNGRRVRKSTVVHPGDEVTVAGEALETAPPILGPSLVEVFRNDDLVAIDKPPGLPSTSGRTPGPSVAAALLDRYPDMDTLGGGPAAGLVHRLDTGTSGLLIAARHPAAYARLRGEFTRKSVTKEYLAVVTGRLDRADVVTIPLARRRRSSGRMVAARDDAKAWPARTEIAPIVTDGALSVVQLHMRTGVTHQLRLHLALLGHPVLGDTRYGPAPDVTAIDATGGAPWHFLHARALHFDADDLPRGIATAFPAHWRALFSARGWATDGGV
jgi:23S rRNA pseudouridine1911/1915/1917 synthase